MSAVAIKSPTNRNLLLRSIALGGIIIFVAQLIHQWIVFSVLGGIPYSSVIQYIASGALGVSAFEGGLGTALIGVVFHLFISFSIAVVFILSAERIPLLRRYPIPAALLYGFAVWFVLNIIVTPLSAAPPVDPPPTMPQIIELIVEHIVVIGLSLGMLVQRNTKLNK